MTRTLVGRIATLALGATLLSTALPERLVEAKRKPKAGVFGVVNGRKFAATNLNDPDDPCVRGIHNPSLGIVTFTALECRKKRRRQGTATKIKKRMYKTLSLSCGGFGTDSSVFPYEIPCVVSAYVEWRTGRFGIPVGATQWGPTYDFGPPVTSSVRMRVDAFDGTNLRGVITGTFDDLAVGPPPIGENIPPTAPAAIDGELAFDFPFQVQ